MLQSRFWTLYITLVILRLLIAVQPSYLHPDELFQTSEISISDVFHWPSIRAWEFDLPHPIRSIVPIYLFQLPLLTHLYFFNLESPTLAFYTVRVQQWLWSLVLDYVVYKATRSQVNLLLYASSYWTLVFQTHTLSNAWESILVVVTLLLTHATEGKLAVGVLAGLGVLTRPSYAFFLIPYAISRLPLSLQRDHKTGKVVPNESEIQYSAFLATTFAGMIVLGVYLDTIYHAGHWIGIYTWYKAISTPINNVWYNSVHDNLAQHGIHSRYQHLINLGILLGPGLLLLNRITWRGRYAAAMISGFVCLSLIPHQEARFLGPVVCLFFLSLKFSKTQRPSKKFWFIWIVFNGLAAIAYGVLHQCGVIPAALWISKEMPGATVTFNDCYPSPQFLVGPEATVRHLYGPIDLKLVDSDILVMPVLSFNEVRKRTLDLALDWEEVKRIPWHADLDRIGDFGLRVVKEAGMGIYSRRSSSLPAAD